MMFSRFTLVLIYSTMKKTPIQKAEEYLQKAKDILNNTPVVNVIEDGSLLHYSDVKSMKKAERINK